MTTAAVDRRQSDLLELGRHLGFLAPLAALLLFQQVFFHVPLGVVLIGALFGARIALIALGIALIYRANRIVNFAQGDLGAVPAALGVMLVLAWHWSYWLGLGVGLVAAVLLGVVVEGLIIRRFFNAPRLILTVATIGLAQVLAGAGLFIPRLFGNTSFSNKLTPPFDFTFAFGGVTFDANDVMTMIIVPACLIGLALFLRRSTVGIAIVGSAERAERAFTLGIPVKRLQMVVWVVASVLAFLAMFLRAGAVGLPVGRVLPATFLVQALAAAVFGRFERLSTIAAASVGLGIVEQAMTFKYTQRPMYYDAVLFVIVLVGLLVTRRGSNMARVDSDSSATWQATREIRPVPRELKHVPEVLAVRAFLWVAIAAFVLTLPMWLSISKINLATIIVIFAIVAASLVVLTGWAGQVSLGQMGFVGVGAAVGGALSVHRGWDLALCMIVAGAVGALTAAVVGYPALRRRGLTLAVSTLAFSLFVGSFFLNATVYANGRFRDWLPGARIDRGTFFGIDLTSETSMFYASLVVLALALAMVVGLRHSRTGRVLIAIRENERAARAYGVNATRTGLAAFALSGFLAAVAGALYVHQQTGLSSTSYSPERSLELFTMVVIGGLGSLPGAILGAVYVFGAEFFLPPEWQFLATGVGLLLVLMLIPSGIGGMLADVRDGGLRRIAARRGIVVPSLLADVRVEEEGADEPPEETVLVAAGELAELAEAVDAGDGAASGDAAAPAASGAGPSGNGATGDGGVYVPASPRAPAPGAGDGTDGDTLEVRS